MIIIYQRPDDPEAFERHYHGVHVPLAKTLPGLRRYETSVGPIAALAGAKEGYFVATLEFDSMDDIRAAFASEAGRACAADRVNLEPDESRLQIFLFDSKPV